MQNIKGIANTCILLIAKNIGFQGGIADEKRNRHFKKSHNSIY